MYGRLDIDAKFRKVLMQKNVIKDNYEYARAHEVEVLHTDWDKTNSLVRATYPEVHLTDEVEALGVVGFIDGGNLTYVDWPLLKETIDYLRTFNPLNDDMNVIIETVLGNNMGPNNCGASQSSCSGCSRTSSFFYDSSCSGKCQGNVYSPGWYIGDPIENVCCCRCCRCCRRNRSPYESGPYYSRYDCYGHEVTDDGTHYDSSGTYF